MIVRSSVDESRRDGVARAGFVRRQGFQRNIPRPEMVAGSRQFSVESARGAGYFLAMQMTCAVCKAGKPAPSLEKDGFQVTRCAACGVGRTVVSHFDPSKFYDETYFNGAIYRDYPGSEQTIRREFRHDVDLLKKLKPEGGRLLEIGSAYGFFLQEAKQHFEVHGVEMAQVAVDRCRSNSLDVSQGELTREILDRIGPLDAIVLLDTIEHIDDVTELMTMAVEHLNPGGIVLITTGDWNALSARAMGRRWRLMTPPMHLWFFTPRSLDALLGRLGCERTELSHPWKIVPFELILSQLAGMLGVKWRWSMPAPLRNFGVPANMFDSMRAVYLKRAV
jgi:SAM-dependent methyltransferase